MVAVCRFLQTAVAAAATRCCPRLRTCWVRTHACCLLHSAVVAAASSAAAHTISSVPACCLLRAAVAAVARHTAAHTHSAISACCPAAHCSPCCRPRTLLPPLTHLSLPAAYCLLPAATCSCLLRSAVLAVSRYTSPHRHPSACYPLPAACCSRCCPVTRCHPHSQSSLPAACRPLPVAFSTLSSRCCRPHTLLPALIHMSLPAARCLLPAAHCSHCCRATYCYPHSQLSLPAVRCLHQPEQSSLLRDTLLPMLAHVLYIKIVLWRLACFCAASCMQPAAATS
jgi:hypothetical protein